MLILMMNLDTISKSLVEKGKTMRLILILPIDDKTLKFKLKNTRNLDRKSLNLLRKREISSNNKLNKTC